MNDTLPTRAEYATVKKIWRDEGMTTMANNLQWYNNRGINRLVEALEKLMHMWREKDRISLFTEGSPVYFIRCPITLGNMERPMHSMSNAPLPCFRPSRRDGDWYSCMRSNIIGGPSIVFKWLIDATGNPLLRDDHPAHHLGTRN